MDPEFERMMMARGGAQGAADSSVPDKSVFAHNVLFKTN